MSMPRRNRAAVNYELAYRIGFHPWEDAANQPSFNEKLAELLEHEERGRAQPYGLALDIGTGSGIWATRLAQRGWQVTGVDLAETALHRAGDRVQEAGVDVRLVHGDVTALRHAGVGSGFQLVLDTGTFHGLNGAQREAMGREVRAISTDGVTVLMLAWAPRRRGTRRRTPPAPRARRIARSGPTRDARPGRGIGGPTRGRRFTVSQSIVSAPAPAAASSRALRPRPAARSA